jgi:Protein of unknown function (DUF3618)
MTTREGEARPAEQTTAEQEKATGVEPSSRAVTGGDRQETDRHETDRHETEPLSGSIAAPPDNARQLQREIERTREQLGDTVQELLARADVKSRALAKASDVSEKFKSSLVQARNRASSRAAGVHSQVGGGASVARQKAASVGKAGKDQLRGRVVAVGTPAWEAMPEQVRRPLTKAASGARQHWMPLAVATGVVVIGCLAAIRLRQARSGLRATDQPDLDVTYVRGRHAASPRPLGKNACDTSRPAATTRRSRG